MIDVQGRCPACGWASLFLGDGGHVTCSRLDCPGPCAADELLHGESGAAALATIGRIRKLAAELFVEGATHTHRNIGRQLLNALQPPEDGGDGNCCGKPAGAICVHDVTAPAHNAGPTVAECAEADRRWSLEKAGE